jgi:hypothetical protein
MYMRAREDLKNAWGRKEGREESRFTRKERKGGQISRRKGR